MKVVYVELDRCIACLSCEQACLFYHASRTGGWCPNIFVAVDIENRRINTGTCLQCEDAPCMAACPTGAIKRNPTSTAVQVDSELCLGCGVCVKACTYGFLHLDTSRTKATKCDLCGGNPICVQMCMARALHFGELESMADLARGKTGLRLGLRAIPKTRDDTP